MTFSPFSNFSQATSSHSSIAGTSTINNRLTIPLKNGFRASFSATKQVECGITDISITMSIKLGCVDTIMEFFIFLICSRLLLSILIIFNVFKSQIKNCQDFCNVSYFLISEFWNGNIKYRINNAPQPNNANKNITVIPLINLIIALPFQP